MSTRYASRRTVLPDPEADFELHAAALIEALRGQAADATIPSIDSSVEVLHRHRETIGRLTAPAIGSPEAVEAALSKPRTLELARTLGIATPRSLLATTQAELEAAAAETGFPCVLKPASSWRSLGPGGERLGPVFVGEAAEVRELGPVLVGPGRAMLVQELVTGGRETIKLFRDRGVIVASLAMTVERTWPPLGGSSVMRRTITPPADSLEAAERLVAEIGLDGYSETEFRRDRLGRPVLMEVNPRLSQSVELATRAGVDFPRMQLEWARGGSIPRPTRAAIGLRLGWLAGDLRLAVDAITGTVSPRPGLGATLGAIGSDYLLHGARLDSFSFRDPRPVLGAVEFAARRLRNPRADG